MSQESGRASDKLEPRALKGARPVLRGPEGGDTSPATRPGESVRVHEELPGGATPPTPLPGARLVPINKLQRDPNQVRRDWRSDDGYQRLDDLTKSIREFGILQPLVVREEEDHYVVIAGGRRLVAAQRAGMTEIPVVVRNDDNFARVRVMQLVENLQRQALTPMDEARAFQELIDLEGMTPPQIALRAHVSEQHVRDRLRILRDQVLADAVERRQLTASVAREINKLPDGAANLLRRRVEAGERVRLSDVHEVRQQLEAAGIVNPRLSPRGDRPVPGTAVVEEVDLEVAQGAEEHASTAESSPPTETRSTSSPEHAELPSWLAESEHDYDGRTIESAQRKIQQDYELYRLTGLSAPAAPSQGPSRTTHSREDSMTSAAGGEERPSLIMRNPAQHNDQVSETLSDLLAGLDRVRVEELLLFALERGWSITGLLANIRAVGS
jgi:ParB family transcriptional regulator, chromosome partitioning protein